MLYSHILFWSSQKNPLVFFVNINKKKARWGQGKGFSNIFPKQPLTDKHQQSYSTIAVKTFQAPKNQGMLQQV
jgi:hypothetical protein